MRRPNKNIRIQVGIKIGKESSLIDEFTNRYEHVKEVLNVCLGNLKKKKRYCCDTKNINCYVKEYKRGSSDTATDTGDDRNNKKENFFIEFTSDGDVVVVGAGNDYGFPQNSKNLNWSIISKLNKHWADQIIIIEVEGLRPTVGRSGSGPDDKCTSVLQCRNGVEMYIGEYLLEQKIPILNKYQHRNYNYSHEEWNEQVNKIMQNEDI